MGVAVVIEVKVSDIFDDILFSFQSRTEDLTEYTHQLCILI